MKFTDYHNQKLSAAALLPILAITALAGRANAQAESPAKTPVSVASVPTTLQAPLPAPALGLPRGERALTASPTSSEVTARLGNKPLTIDDIVSIALSTNRDLASAVETLSQAEGTTVTTRATSFGPTLSTGYTLTRTNQEVAANIGGQSIVTQNQYTNQITTSFTLPIDIAGTLRAATSQSQFDEIAARLDVNRVRNEVVLDAKSAFYDALRDQALVAAAESDLQNAVDRLADAKLRLDAGTVARYDTLSAQTDVATAQKTLIQRRTTLSIALATLNDRLGIDVNTALQLTTRGAVQIPAESAESASLPALPEATVRSAADAENALTGKEGQSLGDAGKMRAQAAQDFVVADPLAPSAADYTRLTQEALGSRAEILREDAYVAAAQKGITIARKGLLPSVSAGYSYTLNPNASAFGGQKQSGQAVLTVNVPLFDAGAVRGRVRTARSQVATAETNRRTQVDAVTLEVRQAILNLQQAQGETSATRQALALADEAYRLARLRYSAGVTKQSGVSPLIELSDAQKTLSAAQSDYVNALYDYNNDRSALDKAVGRYSYTPTGPGYATPVVVH